MKTRSRSKSKSNKVKPATFSLKDVPLNPEDVEAAERLIRALYKAQFDKDIEK